MEYIFIADMILKVYRECGIKDFPIPCLDILRHYEFRTITYSRLKELNPEIYTLCVTASNDAFCDQRNRIIAYNEKRFWAVYVSLSCTNWHTVSLNTPVKIRKTRKLQTVFPVIYWLPGLRSAIMAAKMQRTSTCGSGFPMRPPTKRYRNITPGSRDAR